MISTATVIHYVDDMDEAMTFYEALGLTATTRSPGWSTLSVTQGCELALHISQSRTKHEIHPFHSRETTLSLSVDQLDLYVERLKGAGGSVDSIIEPRDGIPVRMAIVRDPAGNGFQINQFVPPT